MSKLSNFELDQEQQIKDSLFAFVRHHVKEADLSLIDDIVLSYVVAILEEVKSDPVFDVEDFCEMMSAYLPSFDSINQSTVCQWVFELAAQLRQIDAQTKRDDNIKSIEISLPEIKTKASTTPCSPSQLAMMEECGAPKQRVHKLSEMSDGGSTDSSCCLDEIDILQEMFPHVCSIEVKHCLTIASGDIERATQILIDRQENGQCLNQNNSLTLHHVNKTRIDDAELKNRIIERYSYIDKDSFMKEHRPVAPKVEPKKLVRYRDNKIVSLKGERYTEVKKGEDVDDISLKKNKKGHITP